MMREQKGRVILTVALAILAWAGASQAETICDVQEYDAMGVSPLEGDVVTVRGVVTLEPGVFQPLYTSFYMEWEGCGINIFNFAPNIVTATVGDTIDVTGTVTEYQSSTTGAGSTTEIEMSSWSMVGTGDGEFEPTYLNLKVLGAEENEGRLCRTIGVVREENLPYDIYIEQPWSGAEIQVYRANELLDIGGFDVGDTIDVTGVIMQYDRTAPFFDGYELSPRYQSDMMLAVPPPPPEPEFWPNAALRVPSHVFRPDVNEVIPIAYLAPDESDVTMKIFDLQGRVVRTLTDTEYTGYSSVPEFYKDDFFVQGTNGWDGRDDLRRLVPAGAYICRLEVEDGDGQVSVSTAPIVVGIELKD
ncbi:MAG TPA: hypothetical protein VE960_04555 [bacterium]|nr:hypothetical protein [bacterium]